MDCDDRNIDLHIHSSASDGTVTPAGIVRMAIELNLGAIAITDHDTLEGIKALLQADRTPAIPVLTGIEISTAPPHDFPLDGSMHILGYGFDLQDPALNAAMTEAQKARRNRNPKIIDRLNALGLDITLAEVRRLVPEDQLGRPHIARRLVERGLVESINQAFDLYLGVGRPAYIDKHRIPCAEALALVQAAGGVAVLAHPGLLRLDDPAVFTGLLKGLTAAGLAGLEVWYPQHSAEQVQYYASMARRFGLVATGGTDFHGALKPNLQLGYGRGDFHVPYCAYTDLLARIQQKPAAA